jgi:hypothetical protein
MDYVPKIHSLNFRYHIPASKVDIYTFIKYKIYIYIYIIKIKIKELI